jgi:hypothetical protein
MTTYLGIEVLEASPNTREDPSDSFHRSLYVKDPGSGKRNVRARDTCPKVTRPYIWTCQNRAEIQALKEWFSRRRGRLVPFWIPTGRQDLLLAQDVGSSDPGISIQSCGYAQFLFPSPARRHLAFIAHGSLVYRQVLSATEMNGTDNLGLSSPLGMAFPKNGLVSFLVLARLASDDLEMVYHTESIAEATLHYIEIPGEVP